MQSDKTTMKTLIRHCSLFKGIHCLFCASNVFETVAYEMDKTVLSHLNKTKLTINSKQEMPFLQIKFVFHIFVIKFGIKKCHFTKFRFTA